MGGILAAVLILLAAQPAAGRPGGMQAPPGEDFEITYDGLERDAAIAARERGIDPETMEGYLLQERELSLVAAAAEAPAGHRFAGAWIEARPEPHLVVAVVGNGGIEALEALLEPLGGRAHVQYGARHSLRVLTESAQRLTSRSSRAATDAEFTAWVDAVGNQVQVELYSITPGNSAAAHASIDSALVSLGVTTKVNEHPEPPPTPDNRGGRLLDGCTSGLAVRSNQTGRFGYLTAGHCGRLGGYYWWSDMVRRPATLEGRAYDTSRVGGLNRDVEWFSVAREVQLVEPLFHESRSYARPQRGVYVPAIGSTVCHWGAYSEDSGCGNIVSLSSSPGSQYGAYFVEVRGTGFQACKGDSGGPWHVGDLAVGTHVASSPKAVNKLGPFGTYTSCTVPNGNPTSKSAWYQPIGPALSTLNVSLYSVN